MCMPVVMVREDRDIKVNPIIKEKGFPFSCILKTSMSVHHCHLCLLLLHAKPRYHLITASIQASKHDLQDTTNQVYHFA